MSLFLNHFTFNSTDKQDGSGLSRIGATGIFTGLIIGTLAIQIYRLCIKKGLVDQDAKLCSKGRFGFIHVAYSRFHDRIRRFDHRLLDSFPLVLRYPRCNDHWEFRGLIRYGKHGCKRCR